jgi:ATP-dependent exoDNAse (exonuclease V) beta subunit
LDPDHKQKAVLEQAGAGWSAGFVRHEAAPKVANQRGIVRILKSPEPEDGEDKGAPLVSKVLELVGGHLAQDPNRKIGVLLRKRNLMPRIIAEIRSAHPEVDVSGEGGNPLTDSRAVELILGLLTCLDHPGHTAARYLVLKSPAADAFGFPAGAQPDQSPGPDTWRIFHELRRNLMNRGFAAMLREWVRHPAFASRCSEHDLLRCGQLIEVAREFDARGASRLDEFVAHIRTRRIERPGGSGVRVMTIHAAKGLEFEAVVLLELDARQGTNGEPEISDEDGTLEIVPASKDAAYLGMTGLVEAGARRDFMEELSVLYVGMTRACSFLDIVLRENSTAPVARLLRSALPPEPDGTVKRFDGRPMRECNEAGGRSAAPAADPGIATAPAGDAGRSAVSTFKARATYTTPSSREAGGTVNVTSILAPANRAAMQRGELIHGWLARITWIEDGLPGVDALLSSTAGTAGELSPKLVQEWACLLLEEVRTEGTDLHTALSRPPDEPDLWCERRFAVLRDTADGPELLTGSFDRVLVWRDPEGVAIRARIIDFKTDRFSTADERAEIEARYAPQLDAYRKALCILCPGLKGEEVGTSLAFVRCTGADAR